MDHDSQATNIGKDDGKRPPGKRRLPGFQYPRRHRLRPEQEEDSQQGQRNPSGRAQGPFTGCGMQKIEGNSHRIFLSLLRMG
jgi:hypothetical protein